MAANRRAPVPKRKKRDAKPSTRSGSSKVSKFPRHSVTSPCSSSSSTPLNSPRMTPEERVEMRRLAQMLPPHMREANSDVDALQLINDATMYIEQLTATVAARIQNGSLPRESLAGLPSFPYAKLSHTSLENRRRTRPQCSPATLHSISSHIRRTKFDRKSCRPSL
ncbi:hypothetical protein Ddc_01974 [Ditylenchus destructor]|nr:hypothetical protein Ddc_01974 [Ditylenchus destructor]